MTKKEKDHLRRKSPFSGDQKMFARAVAESARATTKEMLRDWEVKSRSLPK